MIEKSRADTSRLCFMGTNGYVRNVVYYDDPHKMQAMGENSGNLVFQHSVPRLFDHPFKHIGLTEIPYRQFHSWRDCEYLVFPAANHLRAGADWAQLCEFLTLQELPLIVFGLGAQGGHDESIEQAIKRIVEDEHVRLFAEVLKKKAVLIGVRGEFTKRVCGALGLSDVHILGCPSLLINPKENLGEILHQKLRNINEVRQLAVTAMGTFEISHDPDKLEVERQLLKYLFHRDGLYIQQSDGVECFRVFNRMQPHSDTPNYRFFGNTLAPNLETGLFWDRLRKVGRFFTDYRDWAHDMQKMDLCIGQRFHGNMVGIANEIPSVFVSYDRRTDELLDTCKLPTVSTQFADKDMTLSDLLDNVSFSPQEFDENRKNIARKYIQLFKGLGLRPSRNIQLLGA